MINLNNINKILFLLILSSCTITSIDTVDDKKIEEEVSTQEYFKKSEVIISPLDDYNIELSVLEKFVTDERINGNNTHHSNLPIPSVVKLSDPSNLDNNIIVRNINLDINSYLLRMGRVDGDYRYFIVYDNYLNILSYNCSNYYGLSVGLLSDKFK